MFFKSHTGTQRVLYFRIFHILEFRIRDAQPVQELMTSHFLIKQKANSLFYSACYCTHIPDQLDPAFAVTKMVNEQRL